MPRPKLRNEFAGKRAGGTIIDFNNRRGRGALDRSARGFPAISYPSIDLLKVRLTRKQPDGSNYTDYEQEAERIRTENRQLIDGFKAWLAEGGLKEKTIGKHVANVAFYINDYLLYEDALRPPAGLEATGEFFNWFFPHKVLWSSVATTKETVAGLKKFYRYLAETGVVETSAYEEFLAVVKRDLPEWLEHYRDFETW